LTLEPFEKNKKLRFLGKKILLSYFSTSDKIEAVYVSSHAENALNTAFDIPKKNRFTTYPKKLIRSQLNALALKKITAAVLFQPSISLSASVKRLASYALSSKANLIVASTHGKVGLPRFVFGSFAESLAHISETDLLLYNQKTKLNKTPKKIVYAHDFSRKGAEGLEKIIDYANKWKASITVVHIPEASYSISFQGPDDEADSYRKYVTDVAIYIEECLKRRGIECDIVIEQNWKKPEAELILNAAKKIKADLIAVTAKSGKTAILLGGSVTRNIMRKSTIPTLVLKT